MNDVDSSLPAGHWAAKADVLDSLDPLAPYRARFVGTEGGAEDGAEVVAYLDGNSLGRPLLATADRLADFVSQRWGARLIRGWDEGWMTDPTRVGDELARVALGAAPGQTTVGDSTTVMLYKLMRAAMSARSDRREIVIDTDNFPTDRFVAEGIAAELGGVVRWIVPESSAGVTEALVREVIGPDTALVVLSHVAYRSGFIADVPAITRAVHEAGALVLWDLCHSVGVVPTELDEWGVDFAVGCTYKYLNGGPGSPAFGYVRKSVQASARQPIWGWMGAAEPFAMREAYEPAQGIRQFISGTPPILGIQPMQDMIALIDEAGLPAVRAKSVALTEFAIELADALLVPLGAELSSPRSADARGGHVTVDHPLFQSLVPALWQRGIIPDFRFPSGLRLGLSPLSTSFAEVLAGVAAIAEELQRAQDSGRSGS